MSGQSMETVRSWLKEHAEGVDDDTDLIESRIVDSMTFIEFVYVIQAASGQQFELDAVTLEDLRTLKRVEARFFS
ncbi:hypothetical protein [Dactylosporangium sp. CA-233914]|uniref:hypothetical protein n=1 Tax=Dactylosporangium sp. CA-233914 TaxID=3239934 RepID=UPI003D92CB00